MSAYSTINISNVQASTLVTYEP